MNEELSRARQVLQKIDSLSWSARLEKTGEALKSLGMLERIVGPEVGPLAEVIRPLIPSIRRGLDDANYAIDQMVAVLEGSTTKQARMVLQLFEDRERRCYPDSAEDSALEEENILASLLPQQHGFYVEVGAWRAIEQSNTWKFFRRGWRGLLIEPVPEAWVALLHRRWADRLCPFAIDGKEAKKVFEIAGPISNIHRPDQPPTPESVFLVVDTRRLADILDHVPEIRDNCDLCSIDVEGHEAAVVGSADWTVFTPRVLIIEHVHGEAWRPTLESHGYTEHARTSKNAVLVRKDSAE